MVEFALVLPLLVIVVFGIIDLSRAYQLQNRLRNSAREGAAFAQFYPEKRMASCGGTGISDSIVEKATQEDPGLAALDSFGIKTFKIDPSPAPGTDTEYTNCTTTFDVDNRVRVEVSAKYQILTPLIGTLTGSNSYTLTGKAEVKVQK